MSSFWTVFGGWLSCPGCGSWAIGPRLFCTVCERHIFAHAGPFSRVESFGCHRWIIDWVPGKSDRLSAGILALKGRHRAGPWGQCAEVFLRLHESALSQGGGSATGWTFWAAPALDEPDHSESFARAFATLTGGQYGGRVLRKGSSERQRGRGSRARRELAKSFVKTSTPIDPGRQHILVDDILTTGATARAVHQALGRPTNFEVWTLAYRQPVAPTGGL